MVLAWEYLQEVFVTLVVISFLILVFILFPGYFTMSRALHPSFSGPWRTPPALSSTLTTFDCFFLFIYRKSYGFEWAFFFSQAFFNLRSLPKFLVQPAFIKASLGAGSWASYWYSKHRPGPSVCLIHSNPQSFIHFKFVFISVNIAKSFTCGENFNKKISFFWFWTTMKT